MGREIMHNLFEYGDILNSPYEAFIFDTNIHAFPVHQHWHHYMEVLYILEGTTDVTCDRDVYHLEPGDMIALLPKKLHSIGGTTKEHRRYYVLKFDLNRFHDNSSIMPQLKSAILQVGNYNPAFIHFSKESLNGYPIESYLYNCAREYEHRNYGYNLAMHASLTCLLLAMVRIWRDHGYTPPMLATQPEDNSVDTITEYIDAHSNQPLTVEDLASMCNMSYSFFAKKYRQLYGRSCKEYIEYIRVTKAEDLLLFSDYDLTYISQETGFSDCSHMIKTFRKYKNITPKQYRLQNTKVLH